MKSEDKQSQEQATGRDAPVKHHDDATTNQAGLSSAAKWNIFFALIAIFSITIAIVFGLIPTLNREEDLRLAIIQTGSQVFYEWESNYVALLYEGRSGIDAANELTGVLTLTNHLSEPIQKLQIKIWIGLDYELVVYPYSTGPKAYPIYEKGEAFVESGDTLKIPVMQRVRQSGFDLPSLFDSDPDAWNRMTKQWEPYLTREAPTVDLASIDPGGAPFWNRETKTVQALFGRILIEYDAGARRYSNVLTLIIGKALSDTSESMLIFGKDLSKQRINFAASQVNKQGYSKVVSPSGRVDMLPIPQVSITRHERLLDVLPTECAYSDLSVTDPKLNRFVLTLVWCDRRPTREYLSCIVQDTKANESCSN